jgi:hypothetical protein
VNDDQILEYLRARARVVPPHDFVGSVLDAMAHSPQRRAAWFAPFLPAAAAITATAAIVAVVFLANQMVDVGPSPLPSPSIHQSPAPSFAPSGTSLVQPGDTVELQAEDASDRVGTITVTRGLDTGGYASDPDPTGDSFYVEVQFSYALSRVPTPAEWGRRDWTLEVADGTLDGLTVGPWEVQETSPTAGPQPALFNFPGAVVPEPGLYTGWLVFAVPREAADGALFLRYSPAGRASPQPEILVREPGSAPDPIAGVPASPEPTYAAIGGLPFPVIDSSEADALFVEPDSCRNPQGGYTVSYPDDWYTNTEIGGTPACTWFSPTSFDADASGTVPDEIAIEIHVRESGLGQIPEWPRVLQETVFIGGYEAARMEDAIPRPDGGFDYVYHYAAWLDENPTGLKVTAWTESEGQSDYLLHKAVLDRIIGTLEFSDFEAEAAANAMAETLFAETDTCTNPEAGYTVAFPEAWYTNTEIGQTPACSWFTPDFFEVSDSGEAPAEVWISIGVIDSAYGYIGTTQVFANDAVTIGDHAGRRVEFNPDPNGRPGYRAFNYTVDFGEGTDTGPTFIAGTDIDSADDYELAKAVLDRIMASLEFTD